MRLAGRRSLLLGALALLASSLFVGCDNPIDPLDKSAKIQGLSYIDFSATWDRWDSDPEYDGILLTLDYKSEFGDGLSFHDKAHDVVVEFWTQIESGPDDAILKSRETLFFSKTIRYSNSDDDIRIPIEAYFSALEGSGIDLADDAGAKVFMVVRVFPPEEFPRTELLVGQPDVIVFKRPTAVDTPNQ